MVFDKLKVKKRGNNLRPSAPAVGPGAPSKKQILQARANYGVNIGACFVNEKWIFHELFPEGADCELEAVTKSVKENGEDGARDKFENHWKAFLDDNDWNWLQEHHVTAVRIPIGYWEIGGGRFAQGTKFEKYGPKVYANAWLILKQSFIEKAGEHNISVLVDVHGLPGGANGADHSGERSSGSADFWGDQSAQLQVLDALQFIADDLKGYENVVGIQIVNEAEFSDLPKRQQEYYAAALNAIRGKDQAVPVVISDGWWADQWVKWVQEKQQGAGGNLGLVVDEHCYRCFSDDDKKKLPKQIIEGLEGDLLTNLTDNGRGVDFMVGEYLCVLDGASWDRDGANDHRDDLVVEYGRRQTQLLAQRAGAGFYFWTYKFQLGNGGEWDFKTMSDKGAIGSPFQGKGKSLPGNFEEASKSALDSHSHYWNQQNLNEKYEHWRYQDGFELGWKDSEEFAKFDGSVIGRLHAVRDARRLEHVGAKGNLKHVWEFEQGYEMGVKEFQKAFL